MTTASAPSARRPARRFGKPRSTSSIEDSPITYRAADGRQFIAAVATGGGIGTATTEVTGDLLIVWGLPKE